MIDDERKRNNAFVPLIVDVVFDAGAGAGVVDVGIGGVKGGGVGDVSKPLGYF